jgi:deoxyribonuclease V
LTNQIDIPGGRGIDQVMPLKPGTGINELIDSARMIQERMRFRYGCGRVQGQAPVKTIGGADASYYGDYGIGVLALLSFPWLEPIGYSYAARMTLFPYIPGLFAFRELPLILAAYEKLPVSPDLLLINGHGYAHQKKFGLACQAGAMLGIPTIGVASRPPEGYAPRPSITRGSYAPVIEGDEEVGAAVRTKDRVKPVYVSAGYKTNLTYAIRMVLDTTEKNRIPEPLWSADRIARTYKQLLGFGMAKS